MLHIYDSGLLFRGEHNTGAAVPFPRDRHDTVRRRDAATVTTTTASADVCVCRQRVPFAVRERERHRVKRAGRSPPINRQWRSWGDGHERLDVGQMR